MREQEKLGFVKTRTKKKLMEKLVFYIFDNYSMYPSTDDIILVSKAACEIFDKLKDDRGGAVRKMSSIIVITYFDLIILETLVHLQTNLVNINSDGVISGSLYNALLYRRRKNRNSEPTIENEPHVDLTDAQKEQIKNFLKTCRLPENKNEMQMILSQHKDFRKDLIHNSFDEYKTLWSFYFVCPDLVSIVYLCFFY